MKITRKRNLLSPPQWVRRIVFGMTQAVFAEALGYRQGTISKWESAGEFTSVDAMKRVRALAKKKGIELPDTWLHEAPRYEPEEAPQDPKS